MTIPENDENGSDDDKDGKVRIQECSEAGCLESDIYSHGTSFETAMPSLGTAGSCPGPPSLSSSPHSKLPRPSPVNPPGIWSSTSPATRHLQLSLRTRSNHQILLQLIDAGRNHASPSPTCMIPVASELGWGQPENSVPSI